MATKKPAAKSASRPKASAVPVHTSFVQPGFWQGQWMPALVLSLAAFVLYGMSIGYGYIQDDQLFIWDNSYVQKGFGGLADIFGHDSLLGFYKDPKVMLEGGRYRPLPLATFAMEVGIFGPGKPGVGHFVNILLYALCALMLYRVLSALFSAQAGGRWFWSVPFLAALLFVVHPVHVEVAANIKSRDEIMALMGSLGALWFMMRYFDSGEGKFQWMAAGSFLLGLLSKENTITFLAVIPLIIWVFSGVPLGRAVSASLPMLGSVLLFLLLRAMALNKPIDHVDELVLNPFFGMNASEKFGAIFFSLGWMLKLLFAPYPLTIDYYPYHVPKVGLDDWRVLLSMGVYLFLGVWALRSLLKNRSNIPAFSIIYFLLTISIVSNLFVRTSTFLNERYLFMPSVAFCLLAAWFLVEKLPALTGKTADKPSVPGIALGAVLLLVFVGISLQRLPDWGGEGAGLVESAIRTSPDSYRANYYYANLLYQTRYVKIEKSTDPAVQTEKQNLLDAMSLYVDKSLQINPGYRLAAPLKVQTAVGRYNQDKDMDKLLKSLEKLIIAQPTNGDMLTMVLNVLKSFKAADPNIYNFFCHRVGYNFYFVKMQDPDGAATFLNLALANYPQDKNTIADLIEVYKFAGNQAKVSEMEARMGQ